MFSIKAVSQTSGVSIETLRAWERRYGIVTPQRDSNGRRSYAPEDVIRLRKLREATERGAVEQVAHSVGGHLENGVGVGFGIDEPEWGWARSSRGAGAQARRRHWGLWQCAGCRSARRSGCCGRRWR